MSECMSERMSECTRECTNEYMSECMHECMSEGMIECMRGYTSEYMNECMSECMRADRSRNRVNNPLFANDLNETIERSTINLHDLCYHSEDCSRSLHQSRLPPISQERRSSRRHVVEMRQGQ